ncbi:MAG: hypothetical protein MUE63_06900 [Xanthomonadales bacterium]|nr:hypothetical protein [Xanthomonadales bacterium]
MLLAVLLCGPKGGTLRDVIACGDYVNHAVFPFERLRDGLFESQKTGLLSCKEGRYTASPRARRSWREAQKKERRVFKAWGLLDRWLERQVLAPVVGGSGKISRKEYNAAVKDYLENF